MIYGIVGDCGSGKTLLMTILAKSKQYKGQKIYANYKLNFPFNKLTEKFFNDYKEFPITNAVVLFDELSLYYSSRRSMSKHNQRLRPFILQTRKRNLELYYTAQQFLLVDVNIRDNTDGIYYPRMKVVRYINDRRIIFHKTETYEYIEGDELYLIYDYYKSVDGGLSLSESKILKVNDYFNLYDTNEILDFEEVKNDDKKKKKSL